MIGQNTRQLIPHGKDAGLRFHREQTRRGIQAVPTALSGLPGLNNGRLQRGGNAGLAPFEDDQTEQDGAKRGGCQQPNRPQRPRRIFVTDGAERDDGYGLAARRLPPPDSRHPATPDRAPIKPPRRDHAG